MPSATHTPISLSDFGLSRHAFLPDEPPLNALPDALYQPWERLAADLPTLLAADTLRHAVDQLPVLSTDGLTTEPQRRRAYSILSFLTHGYIWGGPRPAEVLPPAIVVPLLAVSHALEVPPVATYAALNLWNYRGEDPADLDGLVAQRTFTGSVSESWFYMVSVAMEAAGGVVIPPLLAALDAISADSVESNITATAAVTVTAALESITACIGRLTALLTRMPDHCDPPVFYHAVRPFLAGSLGMANAGLPRGVFYDEGAGHGQWRQLRGGSNGQSSLIQLLDIALGVHHAAGAHSSPHSPTNPASADSGVGSDRGATAPSFHQEVRDYMPGPHRRFLEAVRSSGSLRVFSLQPVPEAATDEVSGHLHVCRAAYLTAVNAMTTLRNSHLQIVARYIVLPSRQSAPSDRLNLASVSSASASSTTLAISTQQNVPTASSADKLTGTGGTALMPFLRKARDETVAAGREVCKKVVAMPAS